MSEEAMVKRLRKAGIGAAVVPTARAVKDSVLKAQERGVIAGWSRYQSEVRVRKDGQKTANNYHVSYWEPAE